MRADDFIRDECEMDAWCEDEDNPVVAVCDRCDADIRQNDKMFATLALNSALKWRPLCLCHNCTESISLGELMEMMDVWADEDEAAFVAPEAIKHAAEWNDIDRDRLHRTIGVAAKHMKGAKA